MRLLLAFCSHRTCIKLMGRAERSSVTANSGACSSGSVSSVFHLGANFSLFSLSICCSALMAKLLSLQTTEGRAKAATEGSLRVLRAASICLHVNYGLFSFYFSSLLFLALSPLSHARAANFFLLLLELLLLDPAHARVSNREQQPAGPSGHARGRTRSNWVRFEI